MFERVKEMMREATAMTGLAEEFGQVCPDRSERDNLIRKFREIHKSVECPHNESHILSFIVEMYRFCKDHPEQEGVFIEAGCYKGGSSAKISIAAKSLGRRLVLYDSFEGIPRNDEDHRTSIFGYSIENWFGEGTFAGGIEEVKGNIARLGAPETCEFVKGWFEETLPALEENVAGAYIDVDLASSTRTCLKYIYPRLVSGGFLVSQDGDFPLVLEVFEDDRFWEEEVGCARPTIHGLRTSKMLKVYKD